MLASKLLYRFSVKAAADLKTFGVVGAGLMGSGIALVANQVAGLNVKLVDANDKALAHAKKQYEAMLDGQVAKKKLTADVKEAVMKRFTFTTKLDDLNDADFVVEAVNENFDLKTKIFQTLDKVTPKNTILASNTSSISITKIAKVTQRPSLVIGTHFFNPVPVMALLEVITGLQTADETLETVKGLGKRLKKEVVLSKDSPGFILNRALVPYLNEAIYVLYEGLATKEDIDKAMRLGSNVPMGPLTLADFVGLDTCLAVLQVLHKEFGDSKYRPCPLLSNYVNAGWLGRKTGRGFYTYK
jgi:3-hydroxybutyryl-CoA dehydrogenase